MLLGQISTSSSKDHQFYAADWETVYEANRDWSKVGIEIDATGLPRFQTYIDAVRPFN